MTYEYVIVHKTSLTTVFQTLRMRHRTAAWRSASGDFVRAAHYGSGARHRFRLVCHGCPKRSDGGRPGRYGDYLCRISRARRKSRG